MKAMPTLAAKAATPKPARNTNPYQYSRTVWTWISIFLVADLVLNIIWMLTIPMSKAPDEEVRIILSDYVFQHGALPNAWEEAVRINGWGFSYALRPMLVNILGAFNMWVVSLFTTSLYAQVLAVRIISCFSGTAMVYFVFRCGQYLGWKPAWSWMAAVICGLMPQITFLAGYHNNDLFSTACVTAVLYCWLRGMREHWTWPDCIKFAIAMGITILSYYNAYPYILFSIPLFFLTAFHRQMTRRERKEMWKKTGAIVLITFLIAGWWFIRMAVLYDGDFLGSQTRLVMGEQFADYSMKPSVIFKPQRDGISYFELWNYSHGDPFSWSKKTFMSSIALLGKMDFLLPAQVYDYPALILQIGLGLFVVQFVWWIIRQIYRWIKKQPCDHQVNQDLLFFVLASLSAGLVIALALYYSWTDDFQPQGRYIIPAFTTFVLAMTAGFRFAAVTLSKCFGKFAPDAQMALSWIVSIAACVFMVLLQGYCYGRIMPDYIERPRLTDAYIAHRTKYSPEGSVKTDEEIALEKKNSSNSQSPQESQNTQESTSSASQAASSESNQ